MPEEVKTQTFWASNRKNYLRRVDVPPPTVEVTSVAPSTGAELVFKKAKENGFQLDAKLIMANDLTHNQAFVKNSGWGKWIEDISKIDIQVAKNKHMECPPSLRLLLSRFMFKDIFDHVMDEHAALCRIEGANGAE